MTTAPPFRSFALVPVASFSVGTSRTRCGDTGHPALSNPLPGGGWAVGTLVDLLVQQLGVGRDALARAGTKVCD